MIFAVVAFTVEIIKSNWLNGTSSALGRFDSLLKQDYGETGLTRSSAIAGRTCDAKACQGLLKLTWK